MQRSTIFRSAISRAAVAAIPFVFVSAGFGQVNGTIDVGEYGAALSLQTTPTGFGNNQSELNGAYVKYLPNGSIRVMLTGNTETNGNGLVVMMDARSGGAVKTTLPGGYGQFGSVAGEGLNQRVARWGSDWDSSATVESPAHTGSIVSPGFNPERALEVNISGTKYFINNMDMTLANDPPASGPDDRGVFINTGGGTDINTATGTHPLLLQNGAINAGNITHSYNNSNTLGVDGFPALTGVAGSSITGFEFEIDARFLDADPGQTTKILPFITNQSGDYLANQFLPGLPLNAGSPINNLGGNGTGGGANLTTPLFDAQVYAAIDPTWKSYLELALPEIKAAGSWFDDANWNVVNPDGTNTTAKFGNLPAGPFIQVDVDSPKVLGGLLFDSTKDYTLSGAGVITLDTFGRSSQIIQRGGGSAVVSAAITANKDLTVSAENSVALSNVTVGATGLKLTKAGAGSLSINNVRFDTLDVQQGQVVVTGTGIAGTSKVKSLAVAAGASVELAANALIVDYTGTSPVGAVAALVGTRLTSANALLNPAKTAIGYTDTAVTGAATVGGQSADADSVIVRYTLRGDANVDSTVTSADFNQLVANFGKGGAEALWYTGDFSGDGVVDTVDFNQLISNFGSTVPGAIPSAPGSVVPEPASAALLGLAAMLLKRRRS